MSKRAFGLLALILILGVGRWWYVYRQNIPSSELATPQVFRDIPSKLGVTPATSPSPSPAAIVVPKKKTLAGGKHVFQSFNNCGPASLSMALSLLGQIVSQQELGQKTRPYQNAQGDNDDKSVTLAELAREAETRGFTAFVRPAGSVEILERALASDLPVITRTWLKPNEDIGHFRVIKGYDQTTQQFIQDDSLQGKDLVYSHADFDELWKAFNYEFLILFPPEKLDRAPAVLGDTYQLNNAWEKALSLSDAALRDNPNDTFAGFNRSVALYHLGKKEEAAEAFMRVEDKLPSRMLWYQLEPLVALVETQLFEEAAPRIDRILKNHNKAYSELYALKAFMYLQQGSRERALSEMNLARQFNSSGSWRANVPLANNLENL